MELVYIQSHPIQYNAPFFEAATSAGLKLRVFYCSEEGFKQSLDKQFGQIIQWDIPLLSGYKFEFIKNNSFLPSVHNGFWGLVNFGLINELRTLPKSIVVVQGWNYASSWIAIFSAKFFGHKLAFRGEAPQNQEFIKRGSKKKVRKFILKHLLFNKIDYFFYIGTHNYNFYRNFGISDEKLIFVPYSVDNKRFRDSYYRLKNSIPELRESLGIKFNETVILFSGKYTSKKRPMDLLKAFCGLENLNTLKLIMMGDGELRNEMEVFISQNNLTDRVILTGFVNQKNIEKYYALSDIFVMPSGLGETWGLSVNEAMNFALKLIVSDISGCSIDLVIEEKTGWVYESGNIDQLTNKLKMAVSSSKLNPDDFFSILEKYSYPTVIESLKKIINSV
jgi:glycosyltransferase involved in cell wall biosynthesis